MKVARTINVAILADALDAQAKVLAATAAALRENASERSESKFLDQHSSPLSKRVYLDHARQGAFPTKRVGKRVLVERGAFDRWLLEQTDRPRRPPPPSGPRSVEADVLEDLGLRRVGGTR